MGDQDSVGMTQEEWAEIYSREFPAIWNIFKGTHSSGRIWNKFDLENNSTVVRKENLAFDHPLVKSYKVNSMGHRSNEFMDEPDLLVAGCSQTFGEGILEEHMWANLLANKLGTERHVNLSFSGWSIGTIVISIFNYIRKYGQPKTIAIMFPDPYRLAMPYNTDVAVPWASGTRPDITGNSAGITRTSLELDRTVPKYSRTPHNLLETLPYEFAIADAIYAVQRIVDYCKDMSINLVWGTWHEHTSYLFEKIVLGEFRRTMPIDRQSYVPMFDATHIDLEQGCHEEYRKESGDLFDYAADGNIYGTSHMGYHANIHVAEKFYQKLVETDNN